MDPVTHAPTTAVSTCVTESFDQANSSTIGPDLVWVTPEPNNAAVTFDQSYSAESVTPDSAFSYTAVGCINVEVTATVVAFDSATGAPGHAEFDLYARVLDDGSDWIVARFQSQSGNDDIIDVFTSAYILIDQITFPEGTFGSGDDLYLAVTGTTDDMFIEVRHNGVTIAAATAAEIAVTTGLTTGQFLTEFPFGENAGLGIDSGSANDNRLDNFSCCCTGTAGESFVPSDVQWTDFLSDIGQGNADLQTYVGSDIVHDGLDLLQILVDDVPAVVLVPKPAQFDVIDIGEEAAEFTHVQGGLLLSLFDRALIYPTRGVEQRPKETTRIIDWTSPQYDDSAWINATNILFASFAKSTWPAFVPWAADFPSDGVFGPFSGAQILWADNPLGNPSTYLLADPGHCYFRYNEPAFAVDGLYRFNLTSDDRAESYLDGQQILTNEDFTKNSSVNVEVTAGTRTLAIHGENTEYLGSGWAGPGGVAQSIQYLTLISQDIVSFTTDQWLVYPYPTDGPPGVTIGFALRVLLEEMQARGLFTALTWTFDDTEDSNGNPWDLMPGFSAQIGSSLSEWIVENAQTYMDVEMDPDLLNGLVLHAWRKGEKGTSSGVTFAKGVNVEQLQARRENFSVNTLLIETTDDWYTLDDGAAAVTYGVSEAMLGLGAPFTRDEATTIGQGQLDVFAVPREEITAVTALIAPYADGWRTGDTVLSPDSTGATNAEIVVGIACDGNGQELPRFTVTLRNVILDPDERIVQSVVRGT